MSEVSCALCGHRIENPRREFQRVIGWECKRDGGGTNALRLRQPVQEFAHRWCVDREARGVSARQGQML